MNTNNYYDFFLSLEYPEKLTTVNKAQNGSIYSSSTEQFVQQWSR